MTHAMVPPGSLEAKVGTMKGVCTQVDSVLLTQVINGSYIGRALVEMK